MCFDKWQFIKLRIWIIIFFLSLLSGHMFVFFVYIYILCACVNDLHDCFEINLVAFFPLSSRGEVDKLARATVTSLFFFLFCFIPLLLSYVCYDWEAREINVRDFMSKCTQSPITIYHSISKCKIDYIFIKIYNKRLVGLFLVSCI